MGWADNYCKQLELGNTIQFRPRGNSMSPTIKSKALVTVEPLGDKILKVNDIVLCKVGGSQYLHFVSAVQTNANSTRYQISNAKGRINGWASQVYGTVTKVEK